MSEHASCSENSFPCYRKLYRSLEIIYVSVKFITFSISCNISSSPVLLCFIESPGYFFLYWQGDLSFINLKSAILKTRVWASNLTWKMLFHSWKKLSSAGRMLGPTSLELKRRITLRLIQSSKSGSEFLNPVFLNRRVATLNLGRQNLYFSTIVKAD